MDTLLVSAHRADLDLPAHQLSGTQQQQRAAAAADVE